MQVTTAPNALTLQQVVEQAKAKNPALLAAQQNLLSVKAQAYLIEGANARHEHEYAVWETAKLPDGKILIPGVITHSTDVVEHPELVCQRIVRFAKLLGKENVIAGADCGFGGRTHSQIAWAKLGSLVEGAGLASRALASSALA